MKWLKELLTAAAGTAICLISAFYLLLGYAFASMVNPELTGMARFRAITERLFEFPMLFYACLLSAAMFIGMGIALRSMFRLLLLSIAQLRSEREISEVGQVPPAAWRK